MEFTIRLAEKGDEEAIGKLLEAIHAQHAAGRPDLFGGGRPKLTPREVAALFGKEEEPVLAAVTPEGELLGYAICAVKPNTNPAQGQYTTLYIDDLNVAASARRSGVGSALLEACRALAQKAGCYNLTLNVWAFNQGAVAFYEKNGFLPQRMILEKIL